MSGMKLPRVNVDCGEDNHVWLPHIALSTTHICRRCNVLGFEDDDGSISPLQENPLSARDIVRLIGHEILWCENNPDPAFTAEYRKGFINGLIQARQIIGEAIHKLKEVKE